MFSHLLHYIFNRFRRLTGRNEVAVSDRDYKFYAPRHKYRRGVSNSISNIPGLPVSFLRTFSCTFGFQFTILKIRRITTLYIFQAFSSPENSSSMATSQGYPPENEVRYTSSWSSMYVLYSLVVLEVFCFLLAERIFKLHTTQSNSVNNKFLIS